MVPYTISENRHYPAMEVVILTLELKPTNSFGNGKKDVVDKFLGILAGEVIARFSLTNQPTVIEFIQVPVANTTPGLKILNDSPLGEMRQGCPRVLEVPSRGRQICHDPA